MSKYSVAVVGATGAVGIEVVRLLAERRFPFSELKLFGRTSRGRSHMVWGVDIPIEQLTESSFDSGIDLAIFCAGGDVSRAFAPIAAKAGCTVIDNSSAFRMNPEVPLVIPEINMDAVPALWRGSILANPNCTTAISLMALGPLHRVFGLRSVIASSYQAVSGSGQKGMDELKKQSEAIARGYEVVPVAYRRQIAFNVIPEIGSLLATGYTDEEEKFEKESRKILNHPALVANVTCVRVPVYRAHSVSITADFEDAISVDTARGLLSQAEGVILMDSDTFATPLEVAGKNECYISRVRQAPAFKNGLSFWVVGDQLLKGAALNAVQIAEELFL